MTKTQEIILNILKELYPYFKKTNTEYYMLGGTLLGAIRHKGFIPWDDDMDLGIPRSQYEIFLKEVENYLPKYLKLQTYKNSDSHYYFSRIVDTRYKVKRMGSLKEREEYVWIDIFPLDGMPNNLFKRKFHEIHLMTLRVFYHIACFDKVNIKRPSRPLSEKIIIQFILKTGYGKHLDMYKYLNKIDNTLKKYPYETSNTIINFMGQYKLKEMFPKAYYQIGKYYPFEDIMLNGPIEYDKILKQMYGDYMVLPDEKDRNVHYTILIKEDNVI